jgi:hypothetical protein
VGLVALGGDIPPEVDLSVLAQQGVRVLVGRGSRDEWYSSQKLDRDLDRLRRSTVSVEAFVFDGGHEWADAFSARAGALVRAVAGPFTADVARQD